MKETLYTPCTDLKERLGDGDLSSDQPPGDSGARSVSTPSFAGLVRCVKVEIFNAGDRGKP